MHLQPNLSSASDSWDWTYRFLRLTAPSSHTSCRDYSTELSGILILPLGPKLVESIGTELTWQIDKPQFLHIISSFSDLFKNHAHGLPTLIQQLPVVVNSDYFPYHDKKGECMFSNYFMVDWNFVLGDKVFVMEDLSLPEKVVPETKLSAGTRRARSQSVMTAVSDKPKSKKARNWL
jgi:hypothetical protein